MLHKKPKIALIYNDEGASKVGVHSLISVVKSKLNLEVRTVTAEDVLNNVFNDPNLNTVLFIIPGGADLPYCEKLNGKGNQNISEFVENGGVYIGICAGAYYGCQGLDYQGKYLNFKAERELGFFEGVAKGCLPEFTQGNFYDETIHSKAILPINFDENNKKVTAHFYYHGGSTFIENPQAVRSSEVFATYENGQPAIVTGHFGKGYYLLSGVHFELQNQPYQEIIVQKSPLTMKEKEQQISQLFTENYGDEIWKRVLDLIG